MGWVVFALVSVFFRSLVDVFGKYGLKDANEYFVGWSWRFFGALFMLPGLYFFGIPDVDLHYWGAVVINGFIGAFATVLYFRAIKKADLSLAVPLTAFTPAFVLGTAWVILGEVPSIVGLLGVLLVVVGSFVLNVSKEKGILEPFKALMRQPGLRDMMMVAVLWSLMTPIDKIGIEHSSAPFWAFSWYMSQGIFLLPVIALKCRGHMRPFLRRPWPLLATAFVGAIAITNHMIAINLTSQVVYVIAVKRLRNLVGVFWGVLLFKEIDFKKRMGGAVVMVAGVLLITLI